MTAKFKFEGGDPFRQGDCRNCGLKEKAHVDKKCLFEPTEYSVPVLEDWVYNMWVSEGKAPWGWLVLGQGSKQIKFVVQLTEFSSTNGVHGPYFELGIRGMDTE